MKKLKVIISGGGTGGHIFPAIAIAKQLERKVKNISILFVGAKDRMEMEKVPDAGYKIEGLWISGFQRSLSRKNLIFPFKLISSIIKSQKIVRKFKADLVIGTGGFASGPLLYVASKKGIPSIIQEQNSYPGITNKILSKYVDIVCVAYDKMDRFFPSEKIEFTGNPIRKVILDFSNKTDEGKKLFKVDNGKKTILVIGGSLGARTINETIGENLEIFAKNNLNLIWQTGISYENQSKGLIQKLDIKGINAHVFIKEMDKAYAAADIIISRSGAIAISELCLIAKPLILVPSPNVSEDHQTQNAQSLVNKNSAVMVKDVDASGKLVSELVNLSENNDLQEELSKNISELAVTNAAERIVDLALELIKK